MMLLNVGTKSNIHDKGIPLMGGSPSLILFGPREWMGEDEDEDEWNGGRDPPALGGLILFICNGRLHASLPFDLLYMYNICSRVF